MTEITNSRRQIAREQLGGNVKQEKSEIERAQEKEMQRRAKKEQRQQELQESASYKLAKGIATAMDKWFLDGVIGFIPGAGDLLPSMLALPQIYVSLFKIKSIPLTLAVIYNQLKDVAIGLIPFYIGNILDFFHRAYLQNMQLIVGYVEDDKDIIDEVNDKAVKSAIMIAIFCFLIYLLVLLVQKLVEAGGNLIDWIGSLFA